MFSQFQTPQQGEKTRSQLLKHISPGEELTREQIMQRANLTYDQVRRQCSNLCSDSKLTWRMKSGKKFYRLRSFTIVIFLGWSVSVGLITLEIDDEQRHPTNGQPTFTHQPTI